MNGVGGTSAKWLLATVGVVVLAATALLLIHLCADGGAMGSAYRACDCRGYE